MILIHDKIVQNLYEIKESYYLYLYFSLVKFSSIFCMATPALPLVHIFVCWVVKHLEVDLVHLVEGLLLLPGQHGEVVVGKFRGGQRINERGGREGGPWVEVSKHLPLVDGVHQICLQEDARGVCSERLHLPDEVVVDLTEAATEQTVQKKGGSRRDF